MNRGLHGIDHAAKIGFTPPICREHPLVACLRFGLVNKNESCPFFADGEPGKKPVKGSIFPDELSWRMGNFEEKFGV